jgi:hypothetical protein
MYKFIFFGNCSAHILGILLFTIYKALHIVKVNLQNGSVEKRKKKKKHKISEDTNHISLKNWPINIVLPFGSEMFARNCI